jgi:hypothetical protein
MPTYATAKPFAAQTLGVFVVTDLAPSPLVLTDAVNPPPMMARAGRFETDGVRGTSRTLTVTGALVREAAWLASPPYRAVTLSDPWGRVVTVRVAVSGEVPDNVPLPRLVEPCE